MTLRLFRGQIEFTYTCHVHCTGRYTQNVFLGFRDKRYFRFCVLPFGRAKTIRINSFRTCTRSRSEDGTLYSVFPKIEYFDRDENDDDSENNNDYHSVRTLKKQQRNADVLRKALQSRYSCTTCARVSACTRGRRFVLRPSVFCDDDNIIYRQIFVDSRATDAPRPTPAGRPGRRWRRWKGPERGGCEQ